MSLYEKIGKLIKQNKFYEIYNSNNSSNDSTIESLISELLLSNKIESENILSSNIINNNNKTFTKNNIEEVQNLIKNCSSESQTVLMAILEIQVSLIGNEISYIKYEKINEKIIEKNIYWVITKEIHKRIHKEKKENEFDEYCHCIHDQKEKYILGTEYNFKYENIDSIICKLKYNNKNIEFIAIKTIFISFYNLACEYIEKYIEINEYNKKNDYNLYSIFENIINDFIYINENLKFVDIDFKQSLNNFKTIYNIDFSFEDLFKDIFFNAIFHNQVLGCQYIHGFFNHDNNIKNVLMKILNIISNQSIPLNKNISKSLNIDNLFHFKSDLTSKIMEKSEKLQICVGIRAIEKEYKIKKEDEKESELITKKEIIYMSGSFDKNENKKLNLISNMSKINMEKIFLDIEKNNIESIPIIKEKIIVNSQNDIKENEDEKENKNINKDPIAITEENVNIDNNKNDNNKINKEKNEKVNMENKSLEEIYEYISKDNKVKNKKKNKRKNKGKNKKNCKNNNNEIIEKESNDMDDPIVLQFKNDLNEKLIFASAITKIKPLISEKWIKTISSY